MLIIKYKACVVPKGYSQIAGLNFDEIFAPVVRIESVRALFAIAAFYGLYIPQIDAKTAFLNGDIDLELYITQIEGFEDKSYPHMVLKLNKSLYGLKQAPRIWVPLLCRLRI
jgi:Reverse transcriptase (RNA-dependent DNA polymerase)